MLWAWVLLAAAGLAMGWRASAKDPEGRREARPPAAQTRPAREADRGIVCVVEFEASGPAVTAAGDQSRLSPMLVRVADARPGKDGQVVYRVEFIGLTAGEHDLRDYLERRDGSALDLPPMPVVVRSRLDAGHGTDLFSSASVPWLGARRYRAALILLGIMWLSVPVIYAALRLIRRQPAPPATPPVRPLTLAEQLRPLAEAAIHGSLSLRERAQLELLMYLYWRDRLGLDGPQAEVVRRLRHDAQAGVLLRAFEGWLHSGRAASAQAADEVTSLLEPYRSVPAIEEGELAGVTGGNGAFAGGGR
jgi:hypothetical protein